MKIVYEVTLYIDRDIAAEYDAWLAEHITEMLTLPGFLGAEKFAIEDEEASPKQVGRIVHYRLENHAAFDNYLRNNAEGMREEGLKRFDGRFTASRRILLSRTLVG